MRIYPPDYHAFAFSPEDFGFVYRVRERLEARRVLGWCCGLPTDARILDIGCGDGFHLRLLKKYGEPTWQLEGVDSDPRASVAATNAGLTVHTGCVEQLPLESAHYDLVLLIMTIEHVSDPVGLLQTAYRLLRPGGRIAVVTDNTGSPDFRIAGKRHWGGYHFPRHWFLFNPSTLRSLARRCHLDVMQLTTTMSPVNWVYSIRNFLTDHRAPAWLVERFSLKAPVALGVFTIVDALFAALGLGGNLRAVLQRPAADGNT